MKHATPNAERKGRKNAIKGENALSSIQKTVKAAASPNIPDIHWNKDSEKLNLGFLNLPTTIPMAQNAETIGKAGNGTK